MPASPRHGSWHFQTLWAIPASIRITNADTSDCLVVVDAVLTRDLLERDTRPPYLGSVQLKYKYSDLRLALSTPPRSNTSIQTCVSHSVLHPDPPAGAAGRDWLLQAATPLFKHTRLMGISPVCPSPGPLPPLGQGCWPEPQVEPPPV